MASSYVFSFCNHYAYILDNGDYDSGPYNVTFLAGTTTTSFIVSIINDNILENDEIFHLTIQPPSAPDGVIVGSPVQATVTIENFDGN